MGNGESAVIPFPFLVPFQMTIIYNFYFLAIANPTCNPCDYGNSADFDRSPLSTEQLINKT